MRIYLDNAATTFPKPPEVYTAVGQYQRELGAPVGRGAYLEAIEVQRRVDRCRQLAAELLGAGDPRRIVFTFNGTDSLNLALQGLIRPGDHVVTTAAEHNSVLRPLRWLSERRGIRLTVVPCDPTGLVSVEGIREACQAPTRLVCVTHASNVTGSVQPIEEVGQTARSAGALMVLDAAQTAGQWPIDLGAFPVDVLCCSGHKGLLGPLGTGLVWLGPAAEEQIDDYRLGGTGTQSEKEEQPETLPDRFESGNHNAPGLLGLGAALEWLRTTGIETVARHERELTGRLLEGLAGIPEVKVHGPAAEAPRTGVVSVTVDGYEPQTLAALLDEHFGVQTRAGFHCAPRIHAALGTAATGGTLRFSIGPFNTTDDVDAAVEGMRELAGAV